MDDCREEVDRTVHSLEEKVAVRLAGLEKALELQSDQFDRRLKSQSRDIERIRQEHEKRVSSVEYRANRKNDLDRFNEFVVRYDLFKEEVLKTVTRSASLLGLLIIFVAALLGYVLS